MNQMELSFSAKIENESFARTSIGAFIATMNPTVDEVAEVKTIISEGVSNAIIHGYQNDGESKVVEWISKLSHKASIIVKPIPACSISFNELYIGTLAISTSSIPLP